MKITRSAITKGVIWLAVLAPVLTSCARTPQEGSAAGKPPLAIQIPAAPHARMVVHKNESCGCCNGWVDHMRAAGFAVEVRNEDNLDPVKTRLGVPPGKGSCHTAEVGGYLIEGHVPAEDIRRLLAQRPDARGLVLPGMPLGSPGMEMPDGRSQPYTVELVLRDGSTRPYATH